MGPLTNGEKQMNNRIFHSAFHSLLQWGLLITEITGTVTKKQLQEEADRLVQEFGHKAEIENAFEKVAMRFI